MITPTGRPLSQITTEPTLRSRISSPTCWSVSPVSAVTTPCVMTSEIRTWSRDNIGSSPTLDTCPLKTHSAASSAIRTSCAGAWRSSHSRCRERRSVAWADNAIKLAVDMTVAGLNRLNLQGNAEQQTQDLRAAMQALFPEAVILVREAREGFGT